MIRGLPSFSHNQSAEVVPNGRRPDPVLSVRQLVKHFRIRGSHDIVHAVNDVSFDVYPGETLALVGESGSGKTTVGRCILKLIEPTSGEIYFQGQNIAALSQKSFRRLRSRIQLVFQEPYDSLNPRMSVREILDENLRLERRLNRQQRQQRVHDLMEMIRLPQSYLTRYPHELTGGEQQRIGIARAISTQPDLVVLDEPTSALDITVRAEIIELLMRLQHEFALSYLFISHDMTAVREISNRVAIMYLGKTVEVAPNPHIFDYQLHPYGQALMSSVLFPDPDAVTTRVVLKGEIPSPVNLPRGCFLHPRCPFAQAQCRHDPFPPTQLLAGGERSSACWFAADFVPEVKRSAGAMRD